MSEARARPSPTLRASPGKGALAAGSPHHQYYSDNALKDDQRRLLARRAVVEVDRAVAEPALVDELEVDAGAVREGALAASDDHGHLEQVVLVDQPGPDRLGGELGPSDGEVAFRRRLQLSYRLGLEVAIDASPLAVRICQRPRVDDLVRSLPDRREL